MNYLEVTTVNDEHILLNLDLVRAVYFLDDKSAIRVEFDRTNYLDLDEEQAVKVVARIREAIAENANRKTVPDMAVYTDASHANNCETAVSQTAAAT